MSPSAEREIDLRNYARALWRRKSIAVIPPIILIAAASVAVRFIPSTYRVSSVVVFENRQRMSERLERYMTPTSGGLDADVENATKMLEMRIRSSGFLEGVVRTLRLDDDPAMRAQANELLAQNAPGKTIEEVIIAQKVSWLRGMISVRGVGPWVYQLAVEGSDPKFIYNLSMAVNEHLFNTVRQELLSEIKAASDFSTQQMEIYKEKLDESQRALQSYERAGRTGGGPVTPIERIDTRALGELLSQTDIEIDRVVSDAEALRAELRAELGVAVPSPVVTQTEGLRLLRDRLDSFERQLAWLLIENAWTAPSVVAQNERIAATRKSLTDAIGTAVEVAYQNASLDARARLAELALLEAQRGSLDVRRRSLVERQDAARPVTAGSPAPRSEDELSWLRQKVQTNEEIYNSFLQQVTSSRITEAVESTQLARGFQIVEPPVWPTEPFAPDKGQILLASLIAGLSLGIGLVFFVDYLDHTLKDVGEIETLLGLPILGTIPKIGPAAPIGATFDARRRALLYTVVGASIVVIIVLFTLRRQI